MTYYQLNTYKHPPNTHFANVKYLYHKQTFKNWCSPVINEDPENGRNGAFWGVANTDTKHTTNDYD